MVYTASALFDRTKIKKAIDKLQPLFSSSIDIFNGKITNNPESIVAWEEITKSRKSVQVIQKGTPSIPIGTHSKAIKYIEPLPIEVSSFISAADLNKIKSYEGTMLEEWRAGRIDDIRRHVWQTKNSMAASCIDGALSWKVRLDGGLTDDYTISFGTVATVATVSGNWQASTTKLSTIAKDVNLIIEALQDAGHGMNPVFMCGRNVFAALMDRINSTTNPSKYNAQIGYNEINFMGLPFRNEQFRYWDSAGTAQRLIADTEIRVIDMDAGHETINMPVDDIDNMRPVPLAIKPITTEDPSGIKLIGRSNPIYIPVVDAIKKATVST